MDESLFDQVGGEAFFVQLVGAFYDHVERDATLRPLYPEDLTNSRRHLALFLVQYWGGPGVYQQERGHPRLRMRHVPFRITPEVRDAWLAAMTEALSSVRELLSDEQFEELRAYFDAAARQLTNA